METGESRGVVDEALAKLQRGWGDCPVAPDRWDVSTAEWDRTRERFDAGTVGGAGAWVRRGDGRALVVRHVDEAGWSEPAGKQEPGEALSTTAVREVREETGVDITLTGLVMAHRIAVHAPERDPLYRLVVVFDATYDGGAPRARDGEIAAVRWVDDHPEELMYPQVAEYPL
ncbi:NUDIX hydrolase [Halobaculum marinum]|uniref:NUDIX hydrolase n=1 Tax=Halobaculum marinum TaxID=3031996 RepID=A0ABD5X0F1_9EURY|nr:NUDIX domain-containing protein [Halobaculum sp. DT55]